MASERLAPASVTKATVRLAKGSSRVRATVVLKRGATIVLTPRRPLVPGTYRVTVSTEVTDLAGNPFDAKAAKGAQPLRWKFAV